MLRPQSRDPLLGALRARLGEGSLDRIELTGLGFHWPNASLVHRLHNGLGYNPVRLALYAAATGAEDTVALPEQRKFSPLFPSYRSTLADLLGLRFIATGAPIETIDPKLRPGDLNLLGSYGGRYLYENPRAMPRALFADRAASADFAAMLKSGEWPDVDLRTTVLLDRHARPEAGHDGERGTARIVSYRNSEVAIEADSTAGGYVVSNDPYHPWWFAAVDGAEAPVLRAQRPVPRRRGAAGPPHGPLRVPPARRRLARADGATAVTCRCPELVRPGPACQVPARAKRSQGEAAWNGSFSRSSSRSSSTPS